MPANFDLTDVKIGINQHTDGSGFEFEVMLTDDGNIVVCQGGDMVSASPANWTSIVEAINTIRQFQNEVSK